MIVAVDFDHVLHAADEPIEGRTMGPPCDGAVQAMTELMLEGDTLIVHTCRDDSTGYVTRWLDYWHVPYHEVTNRKPAADVYLDDKALRHRDWASSLFGTRTSFFVNSVNASNSDGASTSLTGRFPAFDAMSDRVAGRDKAADQSSTSRHLVDYNRPIARVLARDRPLLAAPARAVLCLGPVIGVSAAAVERSWAVRFHGPPPFTAV